MAGRSRESGARSPSRDRLRATGSCPNSTGKGRSPGSSRRALAGASGPRYRGWFPMLSSARSQSWQCSRSCPRRFDARTTDFSTGYRSIPLSPRKSPRRAGRRSCEISGASELRLRKCRREGISAQPLSSFGCSGAYFQTRRDNGGRRASSGSAPHVLPRVGRPRRHTGCSGKPGPRSWPSSSGAVASPSLPPYLRVMAKRRDACLLRCTDSCTRLRTDRVDGSLLERDRGESQIAVVGGEFPSQRQGHRHQTRRAEGRDRGL